MGSTLAPHLHAEYYILIPLFDSSPQLTLFPDTIFLWPPSIFVYVERSYGISKYSCKFTVWCTILNYGFVFPEDEVVSQAVADAARNSLGGRGDTHCLSKAD